ncbi:hypothetical protein FRB98_006332 [Tulasnella sp. 332]|nr:hypothetical protein FRB98_006332 [Tulasnella sp. 332]
MRTAAAHREDGGDEDEQRGVEEDRESDEGDIMDTHCESCDKDFVGREGLFHHLAKNSKHNWCFACSRDFANKEALMQHSISRVHKAPDLKCPLCSSMFKIPSAIAQHIESGACHNISRHQVTAAVHSLKISPTISVSHRLTQGPSTATANYQATERTFNALKNAYECYLCHANFRTLDRLDQHLNSPAHDKDEFKCPKCKKTYKLVSGLTQHIESEVCRVATFEALEDEVHQLSERVAKVLKISATTPSAQIPKSLSRAAREVEHNLKRIRLAGDPNIYSLSIVNGSAKLQIARYPRKLDGSLFSAREAMIFFTLIEPVRCFHAFDRPDDIEGTVCDAREATTQRHAGKIFLACPEADNKCCNFWECLDTALEYGSTLSSVKVSQPVQTAVQVWFKVYGGPSNSRVKGTEAYKLFSSNKADREEARKDFQQLLDESVAHFRDRADVDMLESVEEDIPTVTSSSGSDDSFSSNMSPPPSPPLASTNAKAKATNQLLTLLVQSGNHGFPVSEYEELLHHAKITIPPHFRDSLIDSPNPLVRYLARLGDNGAALRDYRDFEMESQSCCGRIVHTDNRGDHNARPGEHFITDDAGVKTTFWVD